MTQEKYLSEIGTLKQFISTYCKDKHQEQTQINTVLKYNNISYEIELNICSECNKLINYAFKKIEECPHKIKPRCRKCPSPCYEKKEWKDLAKVMRYNHISKILQKVKTLTF